MRRGGGRGRGRGRDREGRGGRAEDGAPGDGVSQPSEDGDAPQYANEADEYWPRHAITWFKQVKDDIDDAIQRRRIKVGESFKGIFEGKFPKQYCGIVTPSEDPLAWFADPKTALEME